MTEEFNAPPPHTRLGAAGTTLISEEAVYGLVLVAGMIVITSEVPGGSWDAVITVLVTVVVFFAAHVYAGVVSRLAADRAATIRTSLRAALAHSMGMLTVTVLPVFALMLGVIGLLDDADAANWALGVDVFLLAVVGWLMAAAHTRHVGGLIAGAFATALLGGVLIALKVLIHL